MGAPSLDGEDEALAHLLDASVILGKLLALESRAGWEKQRRRVGPKR